MQIKKDRFIWLENLTFQQQYVDGQAACGGFFYVYKALGGGKKNEPKP